MISRALLLALCLGLSSVHAWGDFQFEIPRGFRDLSPGVDPSAFAGLPEPLVNEARSGKFAAFAMDFREVDGFYENFNAVVDSGGLRIDEDFARQHRESVTAQYEKLLGGPVVILQHDLTTLGGVTVLRAVYDVQNPDVPMRQLQYVIPGGRKWAILTYTATPMTFARYAPAFEASAAATQGLAEAELFDFSRALRMGVFGGAIGGVIGLVAHWMRKRSAAKPMPRRLPARAVPRR